MPRLFREPLPAITTTATAAVINQTLTSASVPEPPHRDSPGSVVEAKIVVLGSQGVGKTSFVNRFINPNAPITNVTSTIGASFLTKKIHDPDTNTTVRLQVWDTAGQERFRSISRIYYRGAHAGILCYDVTNEQSWEDMKAWFAEMSQNCEFSFNETSPGAGMVLHVVGTKIDLVADAPSKRQVSFERTIAYVAEHLAGVNMAASSSSTPPLTMKVGSAGTHIISPDSKRSSGFWNQDIGWDSCHEVSAQDNEGIEEVFRIISKKLVDQRNKREAFQQGRTPWHSNDPGDYFSPKASRSTNDGTRGSFRLGHAHRKSWLGLPSVTAGLAVGADGANDWDETDVRAFVADSAEARRRGKCC